MRTLIITTVLSLLTTAAAASAQGTTGEIQGTVVDTSGAVLPGATVTLRNTATAVSREVVTDAEGRFAAPGLPIGPYEAVATLQGMTPRRQSDLTVRLGETLTLRLELGVGAVTEAIAVVATAPVVDATRSQVSSVVDSAAISNLPVNGRNFIDFVLLTPGVTRDVRGGDISFAGQRGTLNSLVVDGADNNNTFFGQALGRTGTGRAPYQFSQEAVEEFQVNSSAYSAEYGRAGGAVINVVTKSGTNQFRGSAFEFYRDKALNANTQLNEAAGRAKSPYHYNQFGGVIGGPLVRDRHFFFFNYDGQRNTQPNAVFLNVPANAQLNAAALEALDRLRPLATSWERKQDQDVFLVKTDHRINADHRLSLRYNHQNFVGQNFENGGFQQSVEATGASKVYTRAFNSSLASVVGRSLVNEARVQYARDREPGEANSANPQADVRQGGNLVLRIGRNFFSPRETTIERVQVGDTLTFVRGAHTLKTGFDVQVDDILNFFPGNFSGVYVFQSLAGFGSGVPNGSGDTYTQAFPGTGTTGPTTAPNSKEFAFFLQDEWQVNSNVTVNAGLRYDVQSWDQPPVQNPDAQLLAAGIDTSVLNTDKNNWSPRLGIAWSPAGHRYVVRAGYGVFFGRTTAIMVGTAHSNNGINVQTITFRGANGDPVPTYPNTFSSIPQGITLPLPTIFTFDPDFENPKVQQASAGVEWEVLPRTSVAVTYQHVRGDDLPRTTDINIGPSVPVTFTVAGTGESLPHYQFTAGPFSRFARVISFESSAESRYNGLTVELNRRMSRGLHYRLAYTVGKVEDTVPDATAVVPEGFDDRKYASNPADFDDDRAAGSNDQRHRVVISAVHTTSAWADRFDGVARALVGGWNLSAIYTAQGGQPHSAYVSTDINRDLNRFNDIAPGTTRNDFRLPKRITLDPRISRDFVVGSRARFTVIWEAFNVLNRANYSTVNDTLYTVSGTTLTRNASFGTNTGQGDPRIQQLAFKVSW